MSQGLSRSLFCGLGIILSGDMCLNSELSRANDEAGALSYALLALYDLARTSDIVRFPDAAMSVVSTVVPFEGSWWGRATVGPRGHHVHCSHLVGLPVDTADRLNARDPENIVACQLTTAAGRAYLFDADDFLGHSTTAALADYMGIRQSIAIAVADSSAPGLHSFISVTRGSAAQPFLEPERKYLEMLAPHLFLGFTLCCTMHMMRRESVTWGDGGAIAVTDRRGYFYAAEPGVEQLFHKEWAGWRGCRLPEAVLSQIELRRSSYLGTTLHVRMIECGEHLLAVVRPRRRWDILTPMEKLVATAYASGESHKAVAHRLNMAPGTVRHHLRSIYLKLGVKDKIALARARSEELL